MCYFILICYLFVVFILFLICLTVKHFVTGVCKMCYINLLLVWKWLKKARDDVLKSLISSTSQTGKKAENIQTSEAGNKELIDWQNS